MEIEKIEKALASIYANIEHETINGIDALQFMHVQLLLHIYHTLDTMDSRLISVEDAIDRVGRK